MPRSDRLSRLRRLYGQKNKKRQRTTFFRVFFCTNRQTRELCERNSDFGKHGQTYLVELCTIDCTTRIFSLSRAFRLENQGSLKEETVAPLKAPSAAPSGVLLLRWCRCGPSPQRAVGCGRFSRTGPAPPLFQNLFLTGRRKKGALCSRRRARPAACVELATRLDFFPCSQSRGAVGIRLPAPFGAHVFVLFRGAQAGAS